MVVLRAENRVIDFNGKRGACDGRVSCLAPSRQRRDPPEREEMARGGYSRPAVKKSSPRSPRTVRKSTKTTEEKEREREREREKERNLALSFAAYFYDSREKFRQHRPALNK